MVDFLAFDYSLTILFRDGEGLVPSYFGVGLLVTFFLGILA